MENKAKKTIGHWPKRNNMASKIKPKASKWHLVWALFTIHGGHCPNCRSISPHYNDCPICNGYIVGGRSSLTELDCFIKYLAWLKE